MFLFIAYNSEFFLWCLQCKESFIKVMKVLAELFTGRQPREYELREHNPVATDNYLISIFSAGGYFYLEPRTLQVLFCPCVLNDRDKLGYFLKRKAPKRTPPKPEFRASCFWVLFSTEALLELAWIWFRTDYEIWVDIRTQRCGLTVKSSHAGELILKMHSKSTAFKYKLNQEEK